MTEKRLVFGTGMGGCGLHGLHRLLSGQRRSAITMQHDFLPWNVDAAACGSQCRVLLAGKGEMVGDVHPCWLTYIPLLVAFYDARVLILQNALDPTVKHHLSLNFDFFSAYPERDAQPCVQWCRCFPKFHAPGQRGPYSAYPADAGMLDRAAATRLGYEEYYRIAEMMERIYPDNVAIAHPGAMNYIEDQVQMLTWFGFPEPQTLQASDRYQLESRKAAGWTT